MLMQACAITLGAAGLLILPDANLLVGVLAAAVLGRLAGSRASVAHRLERTVIIDVHVHFHCSVVTCTG